MVNETFDLTEALINQSKICLKEESPPDSYLQTAEEHRVSWKELSASAMVFIGCRERLK
jgi:hypothetical protein